MLDGIFFKVERVSAPLLRCDATLHALEGDQVNKTQEHRASARAGGVCAFRRRGARDMLQEREGSLDNIAARI